jgi:hypothetical protein
MSNDEQPPVVDSPFGIAIFACIVSSIFIYWVARPVVARLEVWWADLLVYSLVPITAAFFILYRSCWHQEMAIAKRMLYLILLSCTIFGGALIFMGVILFALCAILDGFSNFHG